MDRRRFIRTVASTSAAVIVGGRLSSLPRPTWWRGFVPDALAEEKREKSVVSLVRDTDPVKALHKAVKAVDGLAFAKEGQTVLVKPAVNSGNPFPATTDPLIVAHVSKMLKEEGVSRVIVADKSGPFRNTIKCMKNTGIYDAALSAGAEVFALDDLDYEEVTLAEARHWNGTFAVSKLLREVDHVVNLCTARTHFLADHTMAIKNMVGVIPSGSRTRMHFGGSLQEKIAEIGLAVKPSLIVLDARKTFISGGPDDGTVKQGDIIMASTDPVACDAVGLALLRHLGTIEKIQHASVWQRPQLKRAVELGLGASGFEDIELKPHEIQEIDSIRKFLA